MIKRRQFLMKSLTLSVGAAVLPMTLPAKPLVLKADSNVVNLTLSGSASDVKLTYSEMQKFLNALHRNRMENIQIDPRPLHYG